MIRTVVVVGALLLGIGAVAAQQDAVKNAQMVMKANSRVFWGTLAPMVKGEKPFDMAAVTEALAVFDDNAKKLPTLFPVSMKGMKTEGDYSTSPKIWEDKAGFDAAIANFVKAVSDAKVSIKDLDTLKAAGIGKACLGCHETFRVKNS